MKKASAASQMNQQDHSMASITDLPTEVLIDILARLSVKSVFVCRSLCKYMRSIVLTSEDFAKLHSSRASNSLLLVEPNSGSTVYTALHLVEFDKDRHCRFCCSDDDNWSSTEGLLCSSQKYKDHVDMRLGTRFMLPCFRSRADSSVEVVNSCNGLLCLWSRSVSRYIYVPADRAMESDVIAVYNPVTGEYAVIPLPEVDKFVTKRCVCSVSGLWFCGDTSQYKISIRVDNLTKGRRNEESVPMTYTIGSGLWTRVEGEPDECVRPRVSINNSNMPRSLRALCVLSSLTHGSGESCVQKDNELTFQNPDVLVSCGRGNNNNNNGVRCFKIRGRSLNIYINAIVHVPSFLPLEDILGTSVEVFNVRSRLTRRRRGKQTGPCYLVEEDAGNGGISFDHLYMFNETYRKNRMERQNGNDKEYRCMHF